MGLVKRCDCSASANLDINSTIIRFEVCPSCVLEDNVFQYSDNLGDSIIAFTANTFRKPACLITDAGSAFSVAGLGSGTFGGNNFDASFTVSIIQTAALNQFLVTIIGFDETGSPLSITSRFNIEDLRITNCIE